MHNFLALIAIIIVIGGLYISQVSDKNDLEQLDSPVQQKTYQKSPVINSQTYIEPAETKPSLINTKITSGPKEGEIFNDTNEVAFEFSAAGFPEEEKNKVVFETKIEGFDKDWKKSSSPQRKITLPPGPETYTFLVRARIGDDIDNTPAERTFKINVSPYFEKIIISSKSSSGLVLSNRLKNDETINITGWKVGGNKGNIIVPQGIEIYFPYNGTLLSDIILKPSETVYIWNVSNPLGANKNFRPNQCFAYLKDSIDFNVSVPSSKKCPQIKLQDVSYLSESCQNFILSKMRSCRTPDYSNVLEVLFDSNCQAFIDNYVRENLNYQGCFENYSNEDNFLEKKWYIFAGKEMASRYHDSLYIYDREGLLVDKYLY